MVSKATHHLKEKGADVHIIQPKQRGYGFNDVLVKQGVEALRQAIPQEVIDRLKHGFKKVKTPKLELDPARMSFER